MDDFQDKGQGARTPEQFPQTTPKGVLRSYDEMNTGQMVFELQGTVGELKSSIAQIAELLKSSISRVESVEKSSGDLKEAFRLLVPKLEDIAGFAKHRAPHLADKKDLSDLKGELNTAINQRPTRRQSVTDLILIIGLIGTILAIAYHFVPSKP